MGKLTVIKKCELHNTSVYLVNYLLLPNMFGIHYLDQWKVLEFYLKGSSRATLLIQPAIYLTWNSLKLQTVLYKSWNSTEPELVTNHSLAGVLSSS